MVDRDDIVSQSNSAMSAIKMQSREHSNRKLVTITPDRVFAKTIVHTSVLPEDTGTWTFILPWVFFNALTAELQDTMRKDKYYYQAPSRY